MSLELFWISFKRTVHFINFKTLVTEHAFCFQVKVLFLIQLNELFSLKNISSFYSDVSYFFLNKLKTHTFERSKKQSQQRVYELESVLFCKRI